MSGVVPDFDALVETKGSGRGERRGANFSACGLYRHRLWRIWDDALPLLGSIGLNPSTADHDVDDNTIRTETRFAIAWGYGGLVKGNVFQFRATDPKAMKATADPLGEFPDDWLLNIADNSEAILCCWGNHGAFRGRGAAVLRMLNRQRLHKRLLHVGITGESQPRHPLYLPNSTRPQLLQYLVHQ